MVAKWAYLQCSLCFQIKLLVFCMKIMIYHTSLWVCLLSHWTGVKSVFRASSHQNSYWLWHEKLSLHIMYILHIHWNFVVQNRALLDTLRIFQSNNNSIGHIVLYSSLLIGHTQHKGHMRISSCPFVPRKLQKSNHQDYVFIRPPGISHGAFQLRIDNIWFCKPLLLFKLYTKTDAGMQYLECAYVSCLEA